VSRGEREEVELERLIRARPTVTRPNVVAVASPKGGVGKTTCAFLAASLLATHLKLRVVAVDANPDLGTLANLAPDQWRTERSLAELLDAAERVQTAAEVRSYVSTLPSGVHLLGAPRDAAQLAGLGVDRYGELLAFLSVFYEVVVLDLGTGVTGALARFALERADQLVLITTTEWATQQLMLDALNHLRHDQTTLVVNKVRKGDALTSMAGSFPERRLHRLVSVPHDERLALMLDSGTYSLGALHRNTRTAVKRLGLSVREQLV
jgi:MinD-like ATPase involved in chromosome partitioning or flagellar assembly